MTDDLIRQAEETLRPTAARRLRAGEGGLMGVLPLNTPIFPACRVAVIAGPPVNGTFPRVHYDPSMQADYVVRSATWNFFDLVTAQINPDSTLGICSRSVYGHSDPGVNRKPVTAIDQRLHSQ